MAHPYVIRKKTSKQGDKESVRYYGVPVIRRRVTTEEIAETIARRTTFSRGETIAVMSEVVQVLLEELNMGNSVSLEDLGVFSLSATSQGYETPEGCTPHRIKPKRICFRASTRAKKEIKKIKFEKKKN